MNTEARLRLRQWALEAQQERNQAIRLAQGWRDIGAPRLAARHDDRATLRNAQSVNFTRMRHAQQ